jgi:hypothetical protein
MNRNDTGKCKGRRARILRVEGLERRDLTAGLGDTSESLDITTAHHAMPHSSTAVQSLIGITAIEFKNTGL